MTIAIKQNTAPVIPTYDFREGDGFDYRGTDYCWEAEFIGGQTLKRVDDQLPVSFTHEQIHEMLNAPLAPMVYYKGRYSAKGAEHAARPRAHIGDLPNDEQEKVLFRIDYCERFLRKESTDKRVTRSDRSMLVALHDIAKERSSEATKGGGTQTYLKKELEPSPRTVRRWLNIYENDNHPLALCRAYGAPRQNTHFDADETEILERYVLKYASDGKPKMVDLHGEMSDEIDDLNAERAAAGNPRKLRKPSLRTFQNRVNNLSPAYRDYGRLGQEAASKKWNAISKGLEILRPMERIEMDEWRLDLHVLLATLGIWQKMSKKEQKKVPRIRLWVTAAIDVASKCLVALRVHRQAPSAMTAIATLEMTTIDKTRIARQFGCQDAWDFFGSAETVAVDSAKWFTNQPFRVTVNDLGATLFLPPAGKASCRGTIESFFRTSSSQALVYFSGRTWGSIAEKGDRDSEAEASVMFDAIAGALTRFFVDVYHNTPHAGLHDETPRDAWKRLLRQHKVIPAPTGSLRRHIFGINMHRVIDQNGVRFMGIHYQSAALQALRRNRTSQVLVRVDHYDLGEISVWAGDGWLSVKAVYDEFQGMSIWVWTALCDELRRRNLEKAKLARATIRKAKEALRAEGKIARLEAGIDNPVASESQYEYWESKMNMNIEVTEKTSSVPEDFANGASLPEDFWAAMGIEISDEALPDPNIGWSDPMAAQPDDDGLQETDAEVATNVVVSTGAPPRRSKKTNVAQDFDSKE